MKGPPGVTKFQIHLFMHAQKLQKIWALTRFGPKAVFKKYLLTVQKLYLNILSGSGVLKKLHSG